MQLLRSFCLSLCIWRATKTGKTSYNPGKRRYEEVPNHAVVNPCKFRSHLRHQCIPFTQASGKGQQLHNRERRELVRPPSCLRNPPLLRHPRRRHRVLLRFQKPRPTLIRQAVPRPLGRPVAQLWPPISGSSICCSRQSSSLTSWAMVRRPRVRSKSRRRIRRAQKRGKRLIYLCLV